MLFLVFWLLCIQNCLVESVFGQCIRPYTAGPASTAGLATPLTYDRALDLIAAPFVSSVTAPFTEPFLVSAAADAFGAYGGAGIGEASVMGELSTAGTTAIAGQTPILGAVEFGRIVPAAGIVSIAGSCACGCYEAY